MTFPLLAALAQHAEPAAHGAGLAAAGAGEAVAHAVQIPWLWLIPFFPLLGAALNTAFGPWLQKRYGKRANHAIAIGAMVAASVVAEAAFWSALARPAHERFFEDRLWTMWQSGSLKVDLSFALDPLGMVMTLIVTHVATLIHVYSVGYMADEPAYWRFFLWLNLFVFSMLLLVMGSNFAVMFFGWEGVGLCSYGRAWPRARWARPSSTPASRPRECRSARPSSSASCATRSPTSRAAWPAGLAR